MTLLLSAATVAVLAVVLGAAVVAVAHSQTVRRISNKVGSGTCSKECQKDLSSTAAKQLNL